MGYTAVPNEIIEIQHKMSESEFRVTQALLRLTLGYQQTSCKVNYDTLERMTGLSRGGVASGVSAAGARGFFERIGRSGWCFLVYSVDQNSLPVRLNDNRDSLLSRLEKSTSYTKPVYSVDQNTPILKKKENNKEIYIPPYELPKEITPLPEIEDARMEMVSTLSGVVKDTAAVGVTDGKFDNAADDLISRGISIEQVKAFSVWWKANGYYNGKPALTSLLQEIDNSIQGITNGKSNGPDYRALWGQVLAEIKRNGRRSTHQWNGQIAPVLKKAGGYIRLCSLSEFDAEQTFKSAFQDTI